MTKDDIIYEILHSKDWEEALPLACDQFIKDEPMSRGMKAGIEDFGVVLRDRIKTWIETGITIVARSGSERTIVGVVISLINKRGSTTSAWSDLTSTNKMIDIYNAISDVIESSVDLFKEDPSLTLLSETAIICVHPDFQRRGIGKNLVLKCEQVASQRGCQKSTVEASSIGSQAIYLGQGYEKRFEIDYATFKVDGQCVFDTSLMGDSIKNIILVKKL